MLQHRTLSLFNVVVCISYLKDLVLCGKADGESKCDLMQIMSHKSLHGNETRVMLLLVTTDIIADLKDMTLQLRSQ
jgi:hypothetical protein